MKNRVQALLLVFGDILVLVISFFVMLNIRFFGEITQNIFELHIFPFSILVIVWLLIFFIFNLYDIKSSKPTIPHLQKILTAFIVTISISVIFFYTIPFFEITPKTNLLIFGITALILFIIWRRFFYNIFSSYFKKSIIFIIGEKVNKTPIENLKNYIENYPQSGFTIMGIYNSLEQFYQKKLNGNPEIFIISKDIWRNPEDFKKLHNTESEVLDLAYAYEEILGRIPIDAIDEGWFIYNMHKNNNQISNFGKRILSIFVVILILVATSPVLLFIAILIKLYDNGPIFIRQNRVGKNGKIFKFFKFRSMFALDKDGQAENGKPVWVEKEDPRITPIGKILRRLHIDEIPQMLNIIKGDIAFIGPRPERPEFVEKLEKEIPFYYLRHTITPGFTGWAQIKFRYARTIMDSKDKFEYDLYYIKNRNIFMDLGILLRTVQIIFTH